MKLGVVGLLPPCDQISLADAQRVRAAGYRGVSLYFPRPLETNPAAVRQLKGLLDDAGLEAAQANGWYEVLVHSDPRLRALGIRGLQALTHIGRLLDAKTVYVRPGSLNAKGPWYPHPDNYSSATFDRLVDSLRQAARTAHEEGIQLALEGHVLSPLDSPRRMLEVIQGVASPALGFNMDPVNFIGTVRDAYDSSQVLDELFDLLEPYTAAAHLKDLAIQDRLVLHIDEVVIGEGTLDYGRFLGQLNRLSPSLYGIIEHLPDEKIPLARAGLLRAAKKAGVQINGG